MIRLVPSAVAARAFVARPVARGRTHALARLTAPTHATAFWVTLWAAVAVAGFVALIPALFGTGQPLPGFNVVNRLAGVSFAASGLVAWRRRPDSAVGRMLVAAGFGVLLEPILSQIDTPLTFTAATLLTDVWIAVYAALLLSFVTGGRLTSTVDAVLVGTFVIGLLVLQFAVMLFLPEDGNLLLVTPDAGVSDALVKVRTVVLIVAALGVVVVVAGRWRSASRPLRRALLPSLAGSLSGILFAVSLTAMLAGSAVLPIIWLLNLALLTVPAALAWGLLRSRLARGELTELFRELGGLRGVRLEAGLARALGDPDLVLAYRVPGEHAYIDGGGQPVAVPAADGGRATARVERDGRELGLLIYDAALDDDPELVSAVAATAAIALDDARLQTESEDRLAELRASRERLVTAGDAERRRLERNLHDGAQQRLVSVALQLRMAQRQIRSDPELASELLESASRELSDSLEELRELARGIHPAVLNHGLAAALDSLASRAPVATTVSFETRRRLPAAVELAAYFVACEALANVAKYAAATTASVRVSCEGGVAVIQIADDGVGGADEHAGSGLQGLADRVASLDGTLRVFSPPGAGTVVTAELPCAS